MEKKFVNKIYLKTKYIFFFFSFLKNISSVWTVNLNHKNACGRACIRFDYWNFHILSSLMNDSFRPLSSYRNNINEKKKIYIFKSALLGPAYLKLVPETYQQISLLWSTFLQRLLKAERLLKSYHVTNSLSAKSSN